jgi:hypothetical protein
MRQPLWPLACLPAPWFGIDGEALGGERKVQIDSGRGVRFQTSSRLPPPRR